MVRKEGRGKGKGGSMGVEEKTREWGVGRGRGTVAEEMGRVVWRGVGGVEPGGGGEGRENGVRK